MTSFQESQTLLQHTQEALTEQHEKALRLSQKVTVLRCQHQRAREEHSSVTSQQSPEAVLELNKDEEEAEEEEGTEEERSESLNKSQVFSYQTPGLEILQCKYRVAVTEVVELKTELKTLRERLTQRDQGAAEVKPRRNDLLKLERQVATLEKSCQEGSEKVTMVNWVCN